MDYVFYYSWKMNSRCLTETVEPFTKGNLAGLFVEYFCRKCSADQNVDKQNQDKQPR
jgi:hypothetical protein